MKDYGVKIRLILLGAVLACMTACTALSNLVTPAAVPLVQVAVDLAVGTAISKSPLGAKLTAQNILNIANEALALDNGSSVVITAIEATVNARIAQLNLPPPDLQAAQILTATITQLITQRLGVSGTTTTQAGTVTAASKVAIATVLQDVILACQTYGAN